MTQIKKNYLVLSRALKGFEEADTNSEAEGFVQPGQYEILETLTNHPNADTDYYRIHVPSLGAEDTWICARWKQSQYARVVEKVFEIPDLDFGDDPNLLDEQHLVDLLPAFHDFTYDLDEARYPYDLPGFKTPLAPPAQNNCCTFVEGLVAKAWTENLDVEWTRQRHGQMMIFSADDFFSPVSALVESDIATMIEDEDAPPPNWTVVQGWRKQWTSGHTFIILSHDVASDRILTLESNSAYLLQGVGFRKIGNLRDFPAPPENWWERDDLWTWEQLKGVYRFRKMCALKVSNQKWIPQRSLA